jgi:hypothetical protein
MPKIFPSEIDDVLDINPQLLVGKEFCGNLQPTGDDAGWYLLKADYIILIDFDKRITQVIER